MDDSALRAYELQFKISDKEKLALTCSYEDEEFNDILRMSYGKFKNCTFVDYISSRYMAVVKAIFYNVSFINCDFNDVLFINCEFINCKFIDSRRIQNVTFENCIIFRSQMPDECIENGTKYKGFYEDDNNMFKNWFIQ